MRPPPSSLHRDLAARLGIASAQAPAADPEGQNNGGVSWVDQYNTFSQMDAPRPSALDEKSPATPGNPLLTPQTQVDPNSLFGSDQITADVQRKLSKLFRRLPRSLHRNFSLHALLSVLDHTELVMEIASSHVRGWLREKLGSASSAPLPLTSLRAKVVESLKFLIVFGIECLKYVDLS